MWVWSLFVGFRNEFVFFFVDCVVAGLAAVHVMCGVW